MEEQREIGPEEEKRLTLSQEIKQMAQENGLLDEDRAQTEFLRTQIMSVLQGPQTEIFIEQIGQLIVAYHELYEKIDTQRGRTSQFKFAFTLETAALFLDAGKLEEAREELYQAREMVNQEDPRDEELFERIDALYKRLKELMAG